MAPALLLLVQRLFGGDAVLYYTLVFLVIAIVAGALGFGGIAGTATGFAKVLFFVFIVMFVVAVLFGRALV